ncbi:MAG TPA: hypothetical protein VGE97_09380 [Nitrososphaera sp.]|jgi:hypothetical protein
MQVQQGRYYFSSNVPYVGQVFYDKLLDGKIHKCELIEKYTGNDCWRAKVIDDHGGYKKGATFLTNPTF